MKNLEKILNDNDVEFFPINANCVTCDMSRITECTLDVRFEKFECLNSYQASICLMVDGAWVNGVPTDLFKIMNAYNDIFIPQLTYETSDNVLTVSLLFDTPSIDRLKSSASACCDTIERFLRDPEVQEMIGCLFSPC